MAGVELVLCSPAEAEQQRGGLEDVEQRPRGRVPEHHEASAVADHDLTNERHVLRVLTNEKSVNIRSTFANEKRALLVLTNERVVLRPGQAAEGWAPQPPPRPGPPGDPRGHWRAAGPGGDNE